MKTEEKIRIDSDGTKRVHIKGKGWKKVSTYVKPEYKYVSSNSDNGYAERVAKAAFKKILRGNVVRRLRKYFDGVITHRSKGSVYVGLRKGKHIGKIVRVSDHDILSRNETLFATGGADFLITIY